MVDKKIALSLDTIMGDRFGKYAKYIIQDRALPDVRDGLKPVQRRILYSMYKEGNVFSKPYRKSAKTVGNVIGNYHPHGDSSVYDAMVRMSQEWKYRLPLIDMQGNNGSIDNDPAAAMRYTEARMASVSEQLVRDLDKDTVPQALNFDDTEYEPTVFPAAFPNLLVNGATGISAGYATDIPPHNLQEVIDATIHRIKFPNCSLEKIMEYMIAPDFPTGGIIEGYEGIKSAFETGRGKVVLRCKSEFVESKNMNQIVVDEIPYEVNKAELVRKIDEIRFNRSIDGIIEVRDESDRNGLRIVIDLKKEVSLPNTMNYLYKNTDLQKNYNYNMVAIKNKRPVLMGVLAILDGYIDHQIEVVTRSSLFDLKKAKTRQHIVEGLIKAISILDEVVALIRKSKDKGDAKNNLIEKFAFSEKQAEAIVMLQLYRLTNTDIVALQVENNQLDQTIITLNEILDSDEKLRQEIMNRLKEVKKKYPMPRLSKVRAEIQDIKIDEKAMILFEEINVSITADGYLKRMSNRSITASGQTPFGKKEEDHLLHLFKANTTQTALFFTNQGNYAFVPLSKVEEFKWKEVGKHLSYLVKLNPNEKVIETIIIDDFNLNQYVLLATKNGQIKRTMLKDFEVTRYSKVLRCMSLKGDDELISASLTNDSQAILLVTKAGYGLVYGEQDISIIGTKAAGIKAINMKNDCLVSVKTFDPSIDQTVVLISQSGQTKRIKLSDIPVSSRTNKGVTLFKNAKSKTIYLKNAFSAKLTQNLTLVFDEQSFEIPLNKLTNSNLEVKPTLYDKTMQGEVVFEYLSRDAIMQNQVPQVEVNQSVKLQASDTKKHDFLTIEDLLDENF